MIKWPGPNKDTVVFHNGKYIWKEESYTVVCNDIKNLLYRNKRLGLNDKDELEKLLFNLEILGQYTSYRVNRKLST